MVKSRNTTPMALKLTPTALPAAWERNAAERAVGVVELLVERVAREVQVEGVVEPVLGVLDVVGGVVDQVLGLVEHHLADGEHEDGA